MKTFKNKLTAAAFLAAGVFLAITSPDVLTAVFSFALCAFIAVVLFSLKTSIYTADHITHYIDKNGYIKEREK